MAESPPSDTTVFGQTMKPSTRRLLANFYYMRRPMLGFLPLVLGTAALVFVGGICFQQLYQKPLSYSEGFYLTYCLIFMEHLDDYPDELILQVFYWVLPPLGLVVILDGIVRFSSHIMRREDTGKEWIRAMAMTLNNHVVLCGLGKLGIRVLDELISLKQDVIVLEKNPQSPNISFAEKHGVAVLVGTGREEGVFDDLNVKNAKSIILATDDDLANLEMALDARNLNPQIRVVLRMFDQDLASKVRESFDISLAFSTSALAAPLFATSSSDQDIINSFYVGERLLVVAELDVREESKLIGRNVHDLRVDHHIFIVTHEHSDGTVFYPAGDTTLAAGDRITVQTEPATLKQVHKWNRDPQPY